MPVYCETYGIKTFGIGKNSKEFSYRHIDSPCLLPVINLKRVVKLCQLMNSNALKENIMI